MVALLFCREEGYPSPVLGGGTPVPGYPLARTWIPPGEDWGTIQLGLGHPLTRTGYTPPPPKRTSDLGKNMRLGYPLRMWTDRHLWKQYLPHPADAGGKNDIQSCLDEQPYNCMKQKKFYSWLLRAVVLVSCLGFLFWVSGLNFHTRKQLFFPMLFVSSQTFSKTEHSVPTPIHQIKSMFIKTVHLIFTIFVPQNLAFCNALQILSRHFVVMFQRIKNWPITQKITEILLIFGALWFFGCITKWIGSPVPTNWYPN